MLKLLLKKQLYELYQAYFYDAKKNKARSRTSTALYLVGFFLLVFGLLGGLFTFLAVKLCAPMAAAGMSWLYFAMLGLLSVLLGAFGSVFNTYAGLYLPKDNDLLLSMPIPVETLMASRLLSVYLMGLMYSATIMLPTVIVYWIMAEHAPKVIFGGLLLMVLISVFVLTLSCALGWVVAKISQKLKHKSFITVLVSLVFIGAYYFFYFKAQAVIQDLMANLSVYGAAIKHDAYPVYLFGSVGVGEPLACAVVTAVVAVLFGLMWLLLSRSFLKVATSSGKTVRKAYRETGIRRKSVSGALLARELSHFSANPSYILNCGMGTFLMPLCAAALLWKGSGVFQTLGQIFGGTEGSVPLLLCVVFCGLVSMNDIIAPSLSLEGRSLWLIQSLPVRPWQVLRAKIRMQLILTLLPLLLCIVCAQIVCPLPLVQLLFVAVLTASYGLLMTLFGLFLGVRMPNLTWTNMLVPIKQSAPVAITLLVGFAYTALLFAGFMLFPGWTLGFEGYVGCVSAANLVFCVILYLWLRTKGCAHFAAL